MTKVDPTQPRARAAGVLRISRRGAFAIRLSSLATLAAASCGKAADPLAPPAACAASTTPATPPPYAVEFRFHNDAASSLFVHKFCGRYEVGLSSCASGFTDRLNDFVGNACSCDHPNCGIVGGACEPDEGTEITAGVSLSSSFSGTSTTASSTASGQCVTNRDLPAGRYRVSIWVYETADGALARTEPRVVSRDFELPAPNGIVDVPLAPAADDVCDPTPTADVPVCTGHEEHDQPCGLATALTFGAEGGLSTFTESQTLTPPATDVLSRRAFNTGTTFATCSAKIPRCSRDARVVTTGDVAHALAQPDVGPSFGGNTPVFGSDPRGADGSILVVTRPDGKSVGIGGPCAQGNCARPVPAGLAMLQSVLDGLSEQQHSDATCAALPTSP